jgi:predicted DNA-binding antitoxin AbrB/MazE fold protein
MMTAVQAIYDGEVFIPEKPCEITRGSKVTLTIETINNGHSEKQKKLAAFKRLTKEISELNKTDPLPPEFDKILSQRLQFREMVSL